MQLRYFVALFMISNRRGNKNSSDSGYFENRANMINTCLDVNSDKNKGSRNQGDTKLLGQSY